MRTQVATLLVGALLAVGCGPGAEPEKATTLRVAVGLSSMPAQDMTVVLTATSQRETYTFNLSAAGDHYSGTAAVTPGDYAVQAQAFDPAGTLLFEGWAGPYTVAFGSTTMIAVLAQSTKPPVSFGNTPPRISALYVSTLEPALGEAVRIIVAAYDRDPGAVLTYAWTATDGTFDDATSSRPTWTAPGYDALPTLTVKVTDEKGATADASFQLVVGNPTGDLMADVFFNSPPDVTFTEATPTRVNLWERVTLRAEASDPDGDPLSYSWYVGCGGNTYYDYYDPRTVYFEPYYTPPGGVCDAWVNVSDGRGGSNTGSISFWVGPPPEPKVLPEEIVNGSFETGSYDGWSVSQTYGWMYDMTQGIGSAGQTVNLGDSLYDHPDGIWVWQSSPGLPISFAPTDGNFLAFVLTNGVSRGRLFQEFQIPAGATKLAWDMAYTNHFGSFIHLEQALSVRIVDLASLTNLAVLHSTDEGVAPTAIGMTHFEADVSAWAGQPVRLVFGVHALHGAFDAMFDNIRMF